MTNLCSRVGDLEHLGHHHVIGIHVKGILVLKLKLLENERESDADSDIEISNEGTHYIPDTQQPSTCTS